MQILYTCTYWGQEGLSAPAFMNKLLKEGYDGVEIDLPSSEEFLTALGRELELVRRENKDFIFIAQQVLPPATETVDEYMKRMLNRLEVLAALQPGFINSHTGKDHFSFDDNCRIIEEVMNLAEKRGIPVVHETHRGRFSFHSAGILPYLQKFPEIKLTADFSHWCAVSESLLQDQQHILDSIIPHVAHIHARIGYEHGPQVADPFAPEWRLHMERHISWWKKIIASQPKNRKSFTITPEAGPAPYMPAQPYTLQPLGDQWKINAMMKDLLKKELLNGNVL
jgi:sugar phosphate isomerase/epimerase